MSSQVNGMNGQTIVTMDVGGTKVNVGRYRDGYIEKSTIKPFLVANGSETQILEFLISCIEEMHTSDTEAIAIGVPGIVNVKEGVVEDAVNIPEWKAYPLRDSLALHFNLPIYINNDVNCHIAGEAAFGKYAEHQSNIVGICLGTGVGVGYILNGRLYEGENCCAGELGGIPYLDGTFDDYCSGTYFKRFHHVEGDQLAKLAEQGDETSLAIFQEFAEHLATAISYLMFTVDPKLIVIGGSVANSFHLFIDHVRDSLNSFPYKSVRQNLTIVKSDVKDAALLGSALLYLKS